MNDTEPNDAPLSRPVVDAVLQELDEIRTQADGIDGAFASFVRDRLSFAIVLLKYGDLG